MDQRIEAALKFSEYRATLNNQIQQIKFKLKSQLVYSKNGGSFQVDTGLIGFLESVKKQDSVILLDINSTPIEITDIQDFLTEVKKVYATATKKAHKDFQRLRSARKIESIVDFDNDQEK